MNPKPGYKTTEFWLTLLAVIVANGVPLLVIYGVPEIEARAWETVLLAVLNALGTSGAAGAYAYSRAKVKSS